MDYCRALKFEQEPDYKYIYSIFEKCMMRHQFDSKINDFIWKQNRLNKDKEALKNSVLNVIKRKPKAILDNQENKVNGNVHNNYNNN